MVFPSHFESLANTEIKDFYMLLQEIELELKREQKQEQK